MSPTHNPAQVSLTRIIVIFFYISYALLTNSIAVLEKQKSLFRVKHSFVH